MNIDINTLKDKIKKANQFKKLVESEDFQSFMEVIGLLEYKSLVNIKDSYKQDADTMRSSIAYYSAIQDIKSFIVNIDRDLEQLINKVEALTNLKNEENRRNAIVINARNGIINK